MTFPSMLYRGDADPNGVRRLRTCFPGSGYGGLLTNLSSGGDGLAFVRASLAELIARHVAPGWSATHFLSFSAHRSTALVFAAGIPSRQLLVSNERAWDALLIGLDTSRFIESQEVGAGVYRCAFHRRVEGALPAPSIPEWIARRFEKATPKPVRVLLVDAVTYFSSSLESGVRGLEAPLANSQRDAEWLVLPLDAAPEIQGERTSMLDDGCIKSVECFRFGYE